MADLLKEEQEKNVLKMEQLLLSLNAEEAQHSVDRSKWEFEQDKIWRAEELPRLRQEVIRRNIECCIAIIRLNPQEANKKNIIDLNTTKQAEEKILELLQQLQ